MPLTPRTTQRIVFSVLTGAMVIVIVPLVFLVSYIVVQGIGAISWQFLADMPRNGMREGGIFPAIVGTVLLTLGTALFSVPIGIGGGIYLSEYASDSHLTRAIRLSIINLAGVPSVVYGL
ncbi:MAG: phosphate ABC transporter, permease protein PstA, partial [Chloroflexi bacterium]|nr:phosphate ABC transporter, permease protein PstA [Chloroflexota bacterium]